ncbi:MAG: hypothetical protein RLZZ519_2109 [Bacteroidota bacterium]|jgi:hypothetical protein
MGDSAAAGKFLRNFKEKLKVFDILFLDDRGKNVQSMATLEITPMMRRKVIESLVVEDYSEGPLAEAMYGGNAEMWVFGRIVKRQEVYIKITMGGIVSAVICISFHIAEFPMKYPFRQNSANSTGNEPLPK